MVIHLRNKVTAYKIIKIQNRVKPATEQIAIAPARAFTIAWIIAESDCYFFIKSITAALNFAGFSDGK